MEDTGDWERDRHARLVDWIRNDEAVHWLEVYLELLEFFDDLIDKDKEIPEHVVIHHLYLSMIDYAVNPFWIQHHHILAPQIVLGFRHASLANKLERRAKGDDLVWSYIMRQTVDMTMTVIELTRGREIANFLELDIHDWALHHPQATMESFDAYQAEHSN